MANLLGQNIGTNYKGILNLNTLNGNLTTTLEAITDGDGNASTLLLSTTLARVSSNLTIGGSTTASARLHVRGDGTNPIARFENNAGAAVLRTGIGTNNSVLLIGSSAVQPALINVLGAGGAANLGGNYLEFLIQNADNTAGNIGFRFNGSNSGFGNITGVSFFSDYTHSYGAAAGSGNYRFHNYAYTINNSGAQTGTATGIFLNATETALNGMGHNLIDLQVGGVSRFRVTNTGIIITPSYIQVSQGIYNTGRFNISGISDGVMRISNDAGNDFGRLQLGGGTNLFPAIKRNGAAIDFRFADDSGFCNINAGIIGYGSNGESISGSGNSGFTDFRSNQGWQFTNVSGGTVYNRITSAGISFGDNTLVATAQVAINSTTKGFLPPRMTTAQRDLIGTPAAGLMIYNTSTNRPNFYDGSAWVAL